MILFGVNNFLFQLRDFCKIDMTVAAGVLFQVSLMVFLRRNKLQQGQVLHHDGLGIFLLQLCKESGGSLTLFLCQGIDSGTVLDADIHALPAK